MSTTKPVNELPPVGERGWTEDEAYGRLEKDPKHLEGPNCPWHGQTFVVVTKSYGVQRPKEVNHRVISIGWRCRHRDCGNKWGWRHWWREWMKAEGAVS